MASDKTYLQKVITKNQTPKCVSIFPQSNQEWASVAQNSFLLLLSYFVAQYVLTIVVQFFLRKYILVFEKWLFSFDRSNMQIFTVNITRVVWPRVMNILDLRYFCQHNPLFYHLNLIPCHCWYLVFGEYFCPTHSWPTNCTFLRA